RAIQMNILCNPIGKRDAFRAIDWLVEHNNLYTKRMYGGKYSNHQKAQILAELPLLEVYKNTHIQFEKMFCLEHRTTRHSPPKVKVTFAKLGAYMMKHNSNVFLPGRKTKYVVPDMLGKGLQAM
ncbi:hypothetical protein B0H34DRAFT_630754, partial [Crassisporium funariophilum]